MDAQTHILIVDDEPYNLLILEELLGAHYAVHTATDGIYALSYLRAGGRADLILSDVMMVNMDGFELCRQLKADPDMRDIPVLFLTSLESAADEEKGLSLGAEDFIHKPFSPPSVLARVRSHLKLSLITRLLREHNQNLEHLVAERTRELVRQSEELMSHKQQVIAAQGTIITAFCALAEARDNETGNHIRRTQHYVEALARRLSDHPRFADELDGETILLLFKSAPLHDVGKVAIPDAILLKPGKLSAEEWVVMKRHCEYGRDAIAQAQAELGATGGFLHYASEIAYGHHERWDGSGYPQGLAGDAIPLAARLMAAADVYDALISRRVYKPAYSHQQALAIIADGRGNHFDPDIIDALMDIEGQFQSIAKNYCDDLIPDEQENAS